RSDGYAPNFEGFGSISDLFNAFFGGGAGGGGVGGFSAQGGALAVAVHIDLVEAAQGTTANVHYDAVDRCEHCNGNGAEPGTPIETCEKCGGAGQPQNVSQTLLGQMVLTVG